MLVWLLSQGEMLPVQAGARRMRAGMLAAALARCGHSVVWWASTFSHQRKELIYCRDTEVDVEPFLKLKLIHAGSYRRNVSVGRYRHHRVLGDKFRQQADRMEAPDVIVSAFPIIHLAYEAVRYARTREIPVVVDIRDLWPDTYIDKCPRFLSGVIRWLLARDVARTRELLRDADSLVAISQGCLNWGLRYAARERAAADRVFYTGYPEADVGGHEVSGRIRSLQLATKGKVVFTFVGSFGHSYELDLICAAARRVAQRRLDKIRFVLAGDGQQTLAIKRRARSLPNLSLTGWLDSHEIRDLLAVSDVGLVPCSSVVDAMPNKAFEYLSAALPILSSLEGEMERIIATNDVGFSYRCGDLEGLCEVVVKLACDDTLRQRQSRNARDLFVRQFRADTIYDAYAIHVEEMAEKKKGRGPRGITTI